MPVHTFVSARKGSPVMGKFVKVCFSFTLLLSQRKSTANGIYDQVTIFSLFIVQ